MEICLINRTGFSDVLSRLRSAGVVFICFTLRQDNGGHCTSFLRLLTVLPARFDKCLIWVELKSLKASFERPICARHIKEIYTDSPQKIRPLKFVQNKPLWTGKCSKKTAAYPFLSKVKIKTRAVLKKTPSVAVLLRLLDMTWVGGRVSDLAECFSSKTFTRRMPWQSKFTRSNSNK